ncbi:MAG: AAA family ATPase [Nitrospiraceae bacterium]
MTTTYDAPAIKARLSVDAVLSHYGSTPDAQHRWSCLFPERHTNRDRHHSVTIATGRATCWSQKCFESADVFELIRLKEQCGFAEAKQRAAELAGLGGNGQATRRIVATYDYVDEAGGLLFQVVRFEPKDFRQRRPDGHGGWVWNLEGVRLVLYRLPDVVKSECVLILEGEKDVETAYRLGLPDGWAATCNPMGAGKWREEYSTCLQGKRVTILPDGDEPGRRHAEQVARTLQGQAVEIRTLTLPGEGKDLSEWAESSETTTEGLSSLLGSAEEFLFVSPLRNGGVQATNFSPLTASDFLDTDQETDAVEWVLDEYLPAGGLALLAGKPKEGKSTLVYELAVKVAKGEYFLNRPTSGRGVLILGLEEHPRDMRLRLRSLGGESLTNLFVYSGQLTPTPDALESIKRFAVAQHIKLILVDTLAAFWGVRDENDAAEVTKAMKPLLGLARETGACVLLIHHARKSEGSYGDEIRGSGALFASVDVAMIMKRHEVQTQRVLHAVSRYPETPVELVLELRETGYCALGDPSSLDKQARQEKIKAALTDTFEGRETISQRAAIPYRDTCRLLDALAARKEIDQTGKGRRGDPFRYRRNSIPATPPVLAPPLQERNSGRDEFHSCNPSYPCKNRIEESDPVAEEEVDLC